MDCQLTLIKSDNCPHCQNVLSKIPKDSIIKVLDMASPEAKRFNLSGVPSAFIGSQECEIFVDANTFYLNCPEISECR